MAKEPKYQEPGKCPICGSENVDWETCINEGDQLYYPFSCGDCGINGEEWYSLNYIETKIVEEAK